MNCSAYEKVYAFQVFVCLHRAISTELSRRPVSRAVCVAVLALYVNRERSVSPGLTVSICVEHEDSVRHDTAI